MSSPNIAIAFPSGELVSSQFALHMFSFLGKNRFPLAGVFNISSSRIAWNRNAIVEMSKSVKATHLLTIDADTIFPSDALEKLVAHDLDIVGATASKRFDENNDAIGDTLDGIPLRIPSPPVKMKIMGMPFMLIKIHVFEKLRAPWFAEPPWFMLGDEFKDNPGIVPEDEYFCRTAQAAGFDIFCDPELSMQIGHRGPKTFYIGKPKLQPIFPGVVTSNGATT